MPQIEIDSNDRKSVDEIVKFVQEFGIRRMSIEARIVLVMELIRLFKPEVDELKRQRSGLNG